MLLQLREKITYSVCQTVFILKIYLTTTIWVVTNTADAIRTVEIIPQIFDNK